MMKTFLFSLGFTGALLSSAALAEDFTITVPVQLRNLPPSIERMMILCYVATGGPGTISHPVGTGDGQIAVSNGEFTGEAVIRFNADPGRDPATGTHYNCRASLLGIENGALVSYFNSDVPDPNRFPLDPSAPFLLDTGLLPIE